VQKEFKLVKIYLNNHPKYMVSFYIGHSVVRQWRVHTTV